MEVCIARVPCAAYVHAHARAHTHAHTQTHAHTHARASRQVRAYSKVFWARHKELSDWEKVVKNIERGEQKIQRQVDIQVNALGV